MNGVGATSRVWPLRGALLIPALLVVADGPSRPESTAKKPRTDHYYTIPGCSLP